MFQQVNSETFSHFIVWAFFGNLQSSAADSHVHVFMRVGGLFSKTEMSEVLTEILKVDPSFDRDSFLKLCERDIIPNILEVCWAENRAGACVFSFFRSVTVGVIGDTHEDRRSFILSAKTKYFLAKPTRPPQYPYDHKHGLLNNLIILMENTRCKQFYSIHHMTLSIYYTAHYCHLLDMCSIFG